MPTMPEPGKQRDSSSESAAAVPADSQGFAQTAFIAETSDPRLGTTLWKYRLLAKLGEGGMGIVYEAEDFFLKRHVAIKVLPESVLADDQALRRFMQEAQAAG